MSPTANQAEVLDSLNRVRVVRAAPGSGKTWLVAELIRRELDNWAADGSGICALSFTRVAGIEIRNALGYDPTHPHFVGTIDAFVYRYIIRSFRPAQCAAPRLIPAEWTPTSWRNSPAGAPWTVRGIGGVGARTYNLFDICYVDERHGRPVLAAPVPFQGVKPIPDADQAMLLAAKRSSWKRYGWITHADAAFLACELLSDVGVGRTVRAAVARRFRLIVVDELQDSGFYLGKCVRLLAAEPSIRAVLVGDPDQAIYEFNGARPDLFDGFSSLQDAKEFSLSQSRRCPANIVDCARYLKDTHGGIIPANRAQGRSLLVPYERLQESVVRIASSISRARPKANVKVLARESRTIDIVLSRDAKATPPLYSPVLSHIQRAVVEFCRGHNAKALAIARSAIDLHVFGHEGVEDVALIASRVDLADWRRLSIRCLLDCAAIETSTNLYNWQVRAASLIDEAVAAFDASDRLVSRRKVPKPQKRAGWDRPASGYMFGHDRAPRPPIAVPIQTIHSAKGETHEVTVLICPEQKSADKCPSATWWPEESESREERRIAYVAMTRSSRDLILLVPAACLTRLREKQGSFVSAFQTATVDEVCALPW